MRLVRYRVVSTVIHCGMPLPGCGGITEAETDKHIYRCQMAQLAQSWRVCRSSHLAVALGRRTWPSHLAVALGRRTWPSHLAVALGWIAWRLSDIKPSDRNTDFNSDALPKRESRNLSRVAAPSPPRLRSSPLICKTYHIIGATPYQE